MFLYNLSVTASRATSLCTREAENSCHICGGGASLQVSNISVGFQPCQ